MSAAKRGKQFPVEITHDYDEANWEHNYNAYHKGEHVGMLQVYMDGGISDIQVVKEHQRKGVATAMFNYAIGKAGEQTPDGFYVPYPEHSAHRTPSGEAWAKSTGKQHYFPPEEIH